jgi:hypothetical protein
LKNPCTQLDWQLSFVTQILTPLSPPVSSVRLFIRSSSLRTHVYVRSTVAGTPVAGRRTVGCQPGKMTWTRQWLEFSQSFTHVRQVHVWETQLVPGIVQVLATGGQATRHTVLPELISFSLRGYRSSPFAAKAAVQFVTTRRSRLLDRAISLYHCSFWMLPSLYGYCNIFSSNLVALILSLFLLILILPAFYHRLCNYLSHRWSSSFVSDGGSKSHTFGSNTSILCFSQPPHGVLYITH